MAPVGGAKLGGRHGREASPPRRSDQALSQSQRSSGSSTRRGGQSRRGRAIIGQRRRPRCRRSRAIVSRLERSIAVGPAGQGVSTTARTVEAGGARRLERQQRVVDRAQAGPGGDDERQAEVARQVADVVAGGRAGRAGRRRPRRRARCAVAPRPATAATSCGGLERRARQLGGQVRRDRRAEGHGADGSRLGAGQRGEQLVVGRPAGSAGSSRPVTTGLKARDAHALRAQRGDDRRRDDGLADAGVGAGDEDSRARSSRLRPRADGGLAVADGRAPSRRRRVRRRGASARRGHGGSGRRAGSRPPARLGPSARARASRSSALACARPSRPGAAARCRRRHRRRADRLGEHAALERRLADPHRQRGVADDQRHDLGRRTADVEALGRQLVAQARRRWPAARATRRGCSVSSSSAASAPATAGGGGAVEKMNVRAVLTR